MKYKVYLAGPITGSTFEEAQNWRTEVAQKLEYKDCLMPDLDGAIHVPARSNIECLTPLRGNEHLIGKGTINCHAYDEDPTTTGKGITRRDMRDVLVSDCVFVNLLNTGNRISVGTVMEIAWAYQNRIPLVCVMEKDNKHHHAMVDECCTYIVTTLEEGIKLVKFVLNEK